jgi:hypothetical protein
MAQKIKINLERFNDIEMISSNEDNATYRVALSQDSLKNLSLEEKQKIRKKISDAVVQYFDVDDLNNLKRIEQELHDDYKQENHKKSWFNYFYRLLDI